MGFSKGAFESETRLFRVRPRWHAPYDFRFSVPSDDDRLFLGNDRSNSDVRKILGVKTPENVES